MKSAVTLIIFLLCTLFCGNGRTYASNPVAAGYSSSVLNAVKIQKAGIEKQPVFPSIKTDATPDEDDDITCIELDDQDDGIRHELPFRYCNTFHYGSILHARAYGIKDFAPVVTVPVFFKPCIYLTQRSLRI